MEIRDSLLIGCIFILRYYNLLNLLDNSIQFCEKISVPHQLFTDEFELFHLIQFYCFIGGFGFPSYNKGLMPPTYPNDHILP